MGMRGRVMLISTVRVLYCVFEGRWGAEGVFMGICIYVAFLRD